MAVVAGGYFGDYFVNYNQLDESRNWNTKSYDYAVVKPKGNLDEDAKNESPGPNQGTGLQVSVNKHGFLDNNGAFIKDLNNTIYQIRDKNGGINNDYYVDQETGNVYFRPLRNAALGPGISFQRTRLTADAFNGATSITVLDASRILPNSTISIGGQNRVVVSVAGTTVNLQDPLAYSVRNQSTVDLVPVSNVSTTTILTAASVVGATSVNVSSVNNLSVGAEMNINGEKVLITGIAGLTVTFSPPLTVANLNGSPVNPIFLAQSPQYFGTAFNLRGVPNPEDFGLSATKPDFFSYSFAPRAQDQLKDAYSDFELNGVKIASNGLNTNLLEPIPPEFFGGTVEPAGSPQAPLYKFVNSFTTDANDFTPLSPQSRWSGTGAIVRWPGAGSPPNSALPTFSPPTPFSTLEGMWIADNTDSDYNPSAPSAVGVTGDVLFRTKFELTTVPSIPINFFVGAEDHFEIYVNGHAVPGGNLNWPNTNTVNIQPYLRTGENVIGVLARDADTGEAVYVRVDPIAISTLGFDLGSSSGAWEARMRGATEPFATNHNIVAAFSDPWTYESPRTTPGAPIAGSIPPDPRALYNNANGRYTTTALETGTFKKSTFNERSVDNFVVSTDLTILEPGASGLDWAGFQIRSTGQGDNPDTSGYTLKCFSNGTIELYKATLNPLDTANIPLGKPTLVATATVAAFNPATAKNIRIHANGTNIKVFVDAPQSPPAAANAAVPVINWTDTSDYPFLDGYFSFSSQGYYSAYDNFKMTSYAAPIQLLSKALKPGENSAVVKGYSTSAGSMQFSGQLIDSKLSDATRVANGGTNPYAAGSYVIDFNSANLPPDLVSLNAGNPVSIMDDLYRESSLPPDPLAAAPVPPTPSTIAELDPRYAYWSVSSQSNLGVAGKIDFKSKEGGAIQKVKDQFVGVNSLMQNLTSLLGSTDDLFNSHLNLIR